MYRGGLTACSDSDSSDDKSGPSQIVENPPVITPSETEEQKSLYGTYWGSLTVAGKSYDMALVANGTTAALYSTMMTQSYPVVKYVKNADGTYTLHCYNSGEDTTADSTHVKVTFTLGENGSVTCVPLIVPMAAMAQFSTCTKGNAYNGEYGWGDGQQGQQGGKTTYPDVAQSTLYGSYWGKMMGIDCCLVVTENSLAIYSSAMGGSYPAVKFSKDENTNQWTLAAYAVAGQAEPKMTVKWNTSADPYTCVATIVAMNSDTSDMPKGKDYNYEYGGSSEETEFNKTITVTASEAPEKIAALTENTVVKITGELDSDTLTAIATAIGKLSDVYIDLDISKTTGLTELPSNALLSSNIKAIELPESLETIAVYSLYSTGITKLTVPDSVKTISKNAFNKGLKELIIGKGLESFGQPYSKIDNSMEFVTVSDENPNFCSVDGIMYDKAKTKIVYYPIASKLETLVIPDTVTTIGTGYTTNFMHKTNLKKLVIGASVEDLTGNYFYNTPALETIEISSSNANYKIEDDMIFSKDGTKIVYVPVSKSIETFEIPGTVTKIGDCAIKNHPELKSITIGEQVTEIGKGALSLNTALEEIYLNVETISTQMLQGCSSLKTVTFGPKVAVIETNVFDRTPAALESIIFEDLGENITWYKGNSEVELSSTDYAANARTVVSKTFSGQLYKVVSEGE